MHTCGGTPLLHTAPLQNSQHARESLHRGGDGTACGSVSGGLGHGMHAERPADA